jgi:hypothetical protein
VGVTLTPPSPRPRPPIPPPAWILLPRVEAPRLASRLGRKLVSCVLQKLPALAHAHAHAHPDSPASHLPPCVHPPLASHLLYCTRRPIRKALRTHAAVSRTRRTRPKAAHHNPVQLVDFQTRYADTPTRRTQQRASPDSTRLVRLVRLVQLVDSSSTHTTIRTHTAARGSQASRCPIRNSYSYLLVLYCSRCSRCTMISPVHTTPLRNTFFPFSLFPRLSLFTLIIIFILTFPPPPTPQQLKSQTPSHSETHAHSAKKVYNTITQIKV